jgi:hypothetical protein
MRGVIELRDNSVVVITGDLDVNYCSGTCNACRSGEVD